VACFQKKEELLSEPLIKDKIMEINKLTKVYDDHRLNDVTEALVQLEDGADRDLQDKVLSVFGIDKSSKLKNTIKSKVERLHSCEVDGNLSNEITDRVGDPAFNNIPLGLDGELNPIYLNQLDCHVLITGGSGYGKSYLLFKLLKETIKSGSGVTLVGKDVVEGSHYCKYFLSFCGVDEKNVTYFNLNKEEDQRGLESFDFNEAFTKGKITFIRTAEIVSNPVENRNSDKLLWSLLFEPIAKAIVGLSSKVKHILALDEIRWALADEEEYGEFIEIPLSQARSAGISFVIANQPHSSIEKINCGEKYSANMQTKINFPKMT
jgi:hypothetical protein